MIDNLSDKGAEALGDLQGSQQEAVQGEPGWFWLGGNCGPTEARELERLKLVTTQTFPYQRGREAEEAPAQRLAVRLTNYGKKAS